MTEFQKSNPIVQKIWDRLRTLLGAKVHKIKSKEDLEKVAKRYKTLSKFEKNKLIQKSNLFERIKYDKMQVFVKGYKDKSGKIHKGYYKESPIPWTKKEIIKLKEYKSRGRTNNQIASYLNRSPQAVSYKLKKV